MKDSRSKRIAFFKLGVFSHTNAMVLDVMQRTFTGHEIDVIEVWKDLVNLRHPLNVLSCGREYAADILTRRKRLRDCVARTTRTFNTVKQSAARLVKEGNYAFTFQTQSLVDTSTPGVPHFVYTDHTHLANLHYPAFNPSQLYSRPWIALERSIYQNAALTFTMSANIAKSVVEQYGCDPSKVATVYCGYNATPASDQSASDDRYASMNIVFVGIDWVRKGGPQLVEAFKLVRQTYPQAKLTIVGCSPQIDVPNCEVVGKVPLAQVGTFYKSASVCCVPTRIEPFGIVFLEAFANRLPVVSTSIGALPEIVTEGESGYLVDPDDTRQLAARLVELLGDPAKCKRFGEYGHRSAMDRYAWDKVGLRMRDHIHRILTAHHRAA